MKKLSVVGASVVALSAVVGPHPAMAAPVPVQRTVKANIADYNAAQVKAAGDIVTVPDGLATYNLANGTLEVNSRFTVTLPAGFSFSSQPALTNTGAATFTLSSGGIGSQSATFTIGAAPLLPGQSATLLSFAVQGVTALETPIPVAAALPITMQATNNSQINNNDPKALSAPAFASEPGIAAAYEGGVAFIDLSSPTLGTLFFDGSQDTATTAIIEMFLGPQTTDAATSTAAVLSPDGQPNTLSSTDTATITVPGPFNGIAGAFVAANPSCGTVVATGTATPSLLTIPGVPADVTTVFVCLTSGGTTLLQQDLAGFTVAVAPGTSTDFLGTPAQLADDFPGFVTYIGGGVINVTNFFTGDDAGYASLLRVNNAGTSPSNIFALVQPDPGGAPLTGSLGSIGAGEGTVFSVAQVEAAVSGLDLANSGQRATLQLIVTGDFFDVKASSFLVNPGGVVDNVGVQQGGSGVLFSPPPPN